MNEGKDARKEEGKGEKDGPGRSSRRGKQRPSACAS